MEKFVGIGVVARAVVVREAVTMVVAGREVEVTVAVREAEKVEAEKVEARRGGWRWWWW